MSRNGKLSVDKKPRKRRILRFVLWFLLGLFTIAFVVAMYMWTNRHNLIEQQIRNVLAKRGIEAALDIEQISKTSARINDITLSYDGDTFLTARSVDVAYRFDEIRKGKIDRLVLSQPKLRLTLDEAGTIVDPWLPEPGGGRPTDLFPKDGLLIEQGIVDWQAPWGHGSAKLDADIKSVDAWQVDIDTDATSIETDEITAHLDFDGKLERVGADLLKMSGRARTPELMVMGSRAGVTDAAFDLELSTGEYAGDTKFSGFVELDTETVTLPKFTATTLQTRFDIDGIVDMSELALRDLTSDWDIKGRGLSLSDVDLRSRLVSTVMSYNALSSTPIAMHFADDFKNRGEAVLSDFAFEGRGQYKHSTSGYALNFDEALHIRADQQELVLKPLQTPGPEILFNRAEAIVNVALDVDWVSARSLFFKEMRLKAVSENGLLLSGIKDVAADISSDKTWTRSEAGTQINLRPLDLEMRYVKENEYGLLNLTGAVDYDGLLPGGAAKGLKAAGDMRLDLVGETFNLAYTPSKPITLAAFKTDSGWLAENVKLTIASTERILAKTPTNRPFSASLRDITADVSSPKDDRHLQMSLGAMRVKSDFQKKPQNWFLDIEEIDIKSEDFPSPGTHVISGTSTVSVVQLEDGDISFEISSPVTRVETDNVTVKELSIDLAGRPEDFNANYTAGKVRLKREDMPVLPMKGTARMRAGELTGSAVAILPLTKDTPINITYESFEGVGSAHVEIPEMIFTPSGLQPQYLVPALQGRLAEVRGEASATFDFDFDGTGPTRSRGTTQLKNLDVGTLVGPLSGVNTELTFKSIFPLETEGVQRAQLGGFDPGIPLVDGDIQFELVEEGARIIQAKWPIVFEGEADGELTIEPMLWRFGNVENNAVVSVSDVSLGALLKSMGNKSLTATGLISGSLPVAVNGVDIQVRNGVVSVKDGGVIQYKNQGLNAFAQDVEQSAIYGDELEGVETGFAFRALENFEYKELEARIDGPLGGEMAVRIVFDGQNKDVFAGAIFTFNVEVAGELANIARNTARSFDANTYYGAIVDELKRQNGLQQQEDDAPLE